jgi:6-phosphogluconolactonase (cycloisomerase 2 family)
MKSKNSWAMRTAWIIPLLLSLILSNCGLPFFISKAELERFAFYDKEYLYTIYGTGSVKGFSIDRATGAITEFSDMTFGALCSPSMITSDESYRFLYVAGGSFTGDTFGFSISNNGEVTSMPGSPFAGGNSPKYVDLTPNSQFAYIAHAGAGDELIGYRVDGSTGALSQLPGFPLGMGCSPRITMVDNEGEYLYVGDGMGRIFYYSINPSTGAITELTGLGSPLNTEFGEELKQHPFERHMYLLRYTATSSNIRGFELADDGRPVELSSSPWGLGPVNTAFDMDFHPSGKFLFVASAITGAGVHALEVDSETGNLSITDALGASNQPRSIAAEPNGHFVYVGADNYSGGGVIHIFRIKADGSLTEVDDSPYFHGPLVLDLEVVGRN